MRVDWVKILVNISAALLGVYVMVVVTLYFYSLYKGDLSLRPRVLTELRAAGCSNYESRREGGSNPLNVVDALLNREYVFADLRVNIRILESSHCLQKLMTSIQANRKPSEIVFADEKAVVVGRLLTYPRD
jgi:hypothetical protein